MSSNSEYTIFIKVAEIMEITYRYFTGPVPQPDDSLGVCSPRVPLIRFKVRRERFELARIPKRLRDRSLFDESV